MERTVTIPGEQVGGTRPGLLLHVLPEGMRLELHQQTIAELIPYFAVRVARPVFNKTNLTDRYSFDVTFGIIKPYGGSEKPQSDEAASAAVPLPSFAEVMEHQVGLKFQPRKAESDVLVIDGYRRFPRDN